MLLFCLHLQDSDKSNFSCIVYKDDVCSIYFYIQWMRINIGEQQIYHGKWVRHLTAMYILSAKLQSFLSFCASHPECLLHFSPPGSLGSFSYIVSKIKVILCVIKELDRFTMFTTSVPLQNQGSTKIYANQGILHPRTKGFSH